MVLRHIRPYPGGTRGMVFFVFFRRVKEWFVAQ